MKTEKLIELFVLQKAMTNNFSFKLPHNYATIFELVMDSFEKLDEKDKETFSILYDTQDLLKQKIGKKPNFIKNKLVRYFFKTHFYNYINNSQYIIRKRESFDGYNVYANPGYVIDNINKFTIKEITGINDFIAIYDMINHIINREDLNDKRK